MKGNNVFQLCLEKQNKMDFAFKTVHENEVLCTIFQAGAWEGGQERKVHVLNVGFWLLLSIEARVLLATKLNPIIED